MNKPLLSIIIPTFNEEESLTELYERINDVIQANGYTYEIILINDGSTDDTLGIMQSLQNKDPNIRIINFLKNYGKAAALAVGFELCKGKYVITMDADLQDDPTEIPKFLDKMEEGKLDLVSGWKEVRRDPLEKRLPSKLFNAITSLAAGVKLHDFNCGFKCYREIVVKSLCSQIYGDMHRYIPMLAHDAGFKVGEMIVQHHARKYGYSKYGLARYIHGFLDLLTLVLLKRFNKRPMHILGSLGAICAISGFSIESYFLIQWVFSGEMRVRPMVLLGFILIIVGIQFFSLGFISELINQKNSRKLDYFYDEL